MVRPKQTKSILFSLPEGTKPLNGRNEREWGGGRVGRNREKTLGSIWWDFMWNQTPPALGIGPRMVLLLQCLLTFECCTLH